jgi:hypothetical protein
MPNKTEPVAKRYGVHPNQICGWKKLVVVPRRDGAPGQSVTIAGERWWDTQFEGSPPLGSRPRLIGADYRVSLTKQSERAAFGMARGPLGNGTAALRRSLQ